MAQAVVSGLVVTVTASDQQPQVDSFDDLVTCAAAVVGGDKKDSVRDTAERAIRRAVNRMNLRKAFEFNRKQSSAQALVADDDTYTLENDFFIMQDVQLLDSAGTVKRQLEFVDWHAWNTEFPDRTSYTGSPRYWTALNRFDDAQIIVGPTPDAASVASGQQLLMTYMERIQRPSSGDQYIDAPVELGEVLCLYGEYMVLLRHDGRDSTKWRQKYREWESAMVDFRKMIMREPDRKLQKRIPVDYNRGRMKRSFNPIVGRN